MVVSKILVKGSNPKYFFVFYVENSFLDQLKAIVSVSSKIKLFELYNLVKMPQIINI